MKFHIATKDGWATMRLEYPDDTQAPLLSFDKAVDIVAEDLSVRPEVKRMSYDTWYWPQHKANDMNAYITYFMLKTSDIL